MKKTFNGFVKYEIITQKYTKRQNKILLKGFLRFNCKRKKDDSLMFTSFSEELTKKLLLFFEEQGYKYKKVKDVFYTDDKKLLSWLVREPYLIQKEDERIYIAGIFLAKGSVNSLETSYYLDLRIKEIEDVINVKELLFLNGIPTNQIKKKSTYYLYLKIPGLISDFLKLIFAQNAMLLFEEERIKKDFIVSGKKLENLEKTNIIKSNNASKKQIEAINLLKEREIFNSLSKKLQAISEVRIKNPKLNLDELTIAFNKSFKRSYSKSSINHWLQEIIKQAKKYGLQ